MKIHEFDWGCRILEGKILDASLEYATTASFRFYSPHYRNVVATWLVSGFWNQQSIKAVAFEIGRF
jgi:hypothetical protein